VADTNQSSNTAFGYFAIVNTSKMLHHQSGALIGKINANGQPRQLANGPGGTVLATDQAMGESDKLPGFLQIINLARLP
jgi:hypothetical protein